MYHSRKLNRLSTETSPYLQQHARNPVDWYPWGKEALVKAKNENKPILLSIGYSACHWCHVMARESFEDEETARLMNQLFVNIKVDKEERPDLDKVYQTAHYLLNHRGGGWPLTVFLAPDDQAPFFSGTYFPKEAQYQLPAFKDVLKTIAEVYRTQAQEIQQQNNKLITILQHDPCSVAATEKINNQPWQYALELLQQQYDATYGGFGGAPKFPQPAILEFLLANHSLMGIDTLLHMANGGIYDHLSGGFFRYSVDKAWQIPHFEKMLYDNGQLLYVYALAAQYYPEACLKDVTRATARWAMAMMQSPEGGYFSSLDADSERKEGKFYIWRSSEVETLLSAEEYKVVQHYFGLNKPANFEQQWHFYIAQPLDAVAKELGLSTTHTQALLESAQGKLLMARNKRIPPNRDNKILTAWNALMIKGMLAAGHVLHEPDLLSSAQRATAFIRNKLWKNGGLVTSFKDDRSGTAGYLDDYVFFIDALLFSLQITWRTDYLLFAIELAEVVLDEFYDSEHGGFFFTAKNQEQLLCRPKAVIDEALPSGNGVAVRVLLILGYLLAESRYLQAAEKTLYATWPLLSQFPISHSILLLGLRDYLDPPPIIIIRGSGSESQQWQARCQSERNLVFCITEEEKNLPGALAAKVAQEKVCAYLCHGLQCSARIDDMEQLEKVKSVH
ncbi:MAG: hypothetical protein A3E83_07695 [Gammaproteobacteria bacterium RIFCSPHIGHO2_12_FULL_41_20]|nr:MAG: hypothetical protein A3E83_07695 [Gammaproteobacteria bacterium RIFCSPHIGHO2_12_FULL_41_20]